MFIKKLQKTIKTILLAHAKSWIGAEIFCKGIGNVFKKYVLTMN
jgi:hypothetical protein